MQVLHADLATGELTVEMAAPADGRPAGPFGLVLPAAYENLLPLAAALHPTLHLIGPVCCPMAACAPAAWCWSPTTW